MHKLTFCNFSGSLSARGKRKRKGKEEVVSVTTPSGCRLRQESSLPCCSFKTGLTFALCPNLRCTYLVPTYRLGEEKEMLRQVWAGLR